MMHDTEPKHFVVERTCAVIRPSRNPLADMSQLAGLPTKVMDTIPTLVERDKFRRAQYVRMNQEAQDLGDYKDSLLETMGIQSYVERMIDDALDVYEPPTPDMDWIEIFNDVWERSCVREKVLSFLQVSGAKYNDFDEDDSRIARLEHWVGIELNAAMYLGGELDDNLLAAIKDLTTRVTQLEEIIQGHE